MKKNLIYLISMVLVGLTSFVSADIDDGGGMWGSMMVNYGWGIGLFGWFFGVLVLVALVLLIVWLIKQIQTGGKK